MSVVRIAPGHVELGKNRTADIVVCFTVALLVVATVLFAVSERWAWCASFLTAAVLLDLNRRWMNRIHLEIRGSTVRFRSLRTKKLIEYEDRNIQIRVHKFRVPEGFGHYFAARLSFSRDEMPDISIQQNLRVFNRHSAGFTEADDYVKRMASAIGVIPSAPT